MKFVTTAFLIFLFCTSALSTSPYRYHQPQPTDSALANVIEGTVFAPNRQPVTDLWVELQNEFNVNYGRVRTDGSGRFTFRGLASGRYIIKVYTTGTNFEEQSETVEIVNVVQNASDTVYQDVVLHYRKRSSDNGVYQMTDAVFVQDIPDEAKRLYKTGSKDLAGKEIQKGQEELDQAIKLFPDYYDALNALGCSYVETKEYVKSLPYLIQSINVNQRSFSSFYSLAYAAYKLNRLPEASEAARGAVILQPSSVNSQLLYGTILRMNGDLNLAEKTLLKSEKLSKDAPIAEIHWQLALLYNKLNRNKEAADQLETYLKIAPGVENEKQVQDLIKKLRTKSAADKKATT